MPLEVKSAYEFTVVQLKELLKQRNLLTTGTKPELIARLMHHDPTGEWMNEFVEDIEEDINKQPRDHTSSETNKEQRRASSEHEMTVRELEIMRRENAILEREIQVLRRENEVARSSAGSPASSSTARSNVNIKAVSELLSDFSGSDRDFSNWETQLKLLVATYELDDNLAKILLSTKLKAKALAWLHSKPQHVTMSLTELLAEMKKMFDHRLNKLERRRIFEVRNWLTHEQFSDYYHQKLILANQVPIPEDELIDYLIDGIPDRQLQNQARIQSFESSSDLLGAFEKISLQSETTRYHVKADSTRNHMKTDSQAFRKTEVRNYKPQPSTESSRKFVRCYRCQRTGHTIHECRQPRKQTCYVCNEEGHIAKDCPQKQQNVNNVYEEPLNGDEFCKNVVLEVSESDRGCIHTLNCLIDSGSPISFVKAKFIDSKLIENVNSEECIYSGINDSKLIFIGKINSRLTIDGDMRNNVTVFVVPDNTMRSSMVLGRDVMRKFGLGLSKVNIENETYEIMNIDTSRTEKNPIDIIEVNPEIMHDSRIQFEELFVTKYVQPERPDTPKVKVELKLNLNNVQPFHVTPRRLSYVEKEKLKAILDNLLQKGTIRPSESEFASPIVLVRKKNGELRMCVDFRSLNKVTARDNYPLPLIEDQLDALNGKHYFSLLDLKDAFHHINVAEESIKYTSFVTPLGQYEYLKMPFGLKTAPSRFQRFINEALSELLQTSDVVVYLDDVLVATCTLEQHLQVLKKVFKIFVENKMELRYDKCRFLFTEIEYLGYRVSGEGIRPTKSGIEAVERFPTPKCARDVQCFIGLCQYFRKFIEKFSIIAKPLYDLIKKDTTFKFDEKELEAFQLLKDKLVAAPILAIYSPRDTTELHCDASTLGFGAALMQQKSDGRFHPCFYFSKRTSEAETKYHSFELETLAIIYALRRFRIYLQGIKFKIITDCNSLKLTLEKKDINARIARWALELQNYDYETEHRSSDRMRHVDALSRCFNILAIEDNPFEWNLSVCQSKDPEIIKIRNMLETRDDSVYEMRNGLVYKKRGEDLLFCVPRNMEKSVLFRYHDEVGHLGLEKTVEAIRNVYWFPKMREKIEDHIKNCVKCIFFSPSSGRSEGYLSIIPKGDIPFATVHIDHFGPVGKKESTEHYILLVVDAFTKFIKLYATKSTSSKETISYMSQYFRNYNRPMVIISDRGTAFTSKEFEEFLSNNHIKHIKIATGSPQANGQAERMNRILGPMLAKLNNDKTGKEWFKVLEQVEYGFNNTVNRSTGETPSRLLFGINQRGILIDDVREFLENNVQVNIRDLDVLRKQSAERIEKCQNYNKEYIDKKRKKPCEYKVGDYVMIRNFENTPGMPKKLVPQFKGPYEIFKRLRNNRYVIKDVEGFQNTQKPYQGVWEVSNLRPWSRINDPDITDNMS